jgi:hypothetical protein
MPDLIFKAADLRRVVEHSLAAPKQAEHAVDYDQKTGNPITKPVDAPAVILVHDDGVYLMSNGEPGDIVNAPSRYVVHAKGTNPATDPDYYDTARMLVGGDDFGETLPWAREIKALIDGGAAEIVIRMRGDSIELVS